MEASSLTVNLPHAHPVPRPHPKPHPHLTSVLTGKVSLVSSPAPILPFQGQGQHSGQVGSRASIASQSLG